jgi:response regulator RpfG family c-di-GMP phosphodiesterase
MMNGASEPCQPDTPLYSSRIIAGYVRFIERYHNYVDVDELLSYAKLEPYQVVDEDCWFTQEQINRFHEKLATLTKNKDIARDVGRYTASFDSLGMMKSYALGFVSPAWLSELVGKSIGHFARSCVWEAKKTGQSEVHIAVTPRPGVREEPFQCENRIGFLETIFSLFNHELPAIEHTECVFKGADACRYRITWRKGKSETWRKVRNCVALPLFAVSISRVFFPIPEAIWLGSVFAFFATVLFLSYRVWNMEKTELTAAVANLRSSADILFDKVGASFDQAKLIHEAGVALTGKRNIESMLREVTQILEKRLDYDRGMILLADKEKKVLTFKTGFGYSEDQRTVVENAVFRLRPESKGVFVACFREQKPILVNDLDEIKCELSGHSLDVARLMQAKAFICCPIAWADEALGVLAVDNMNTKRTLLQSDIDLLMLLTPAIGMGIQNATVTDIKERQFNSILQVLASSIDARDPLTAGHSERVTRFATGICGELGLGEEFREMIRVASLLHDYGKIAIKDSILKKPGALTPEEFEEIKTHATKTKEILEKIEFEGIYKEVPKIASSHHERWDGTGYPMGLRLKEIPLGARILAVADVFEAITSKRHYRGPMPMREAFKVLESGKNQHFDPVIVDAFTEYYKREGRYNDTAPIEPKRVDKPMLRTVADGERAIRSKTSPRA